MSESFDSFKNRQAPFQGRSDVCLTHFKSWPAVDIKVAYVVEKYLSDFNEEDLKFLSGEAILSCIPANEYRDRLLMIFAINRNLGKYLAPSQNSK